LKRTAVILPQAGILPQVIRATFWCRLPSPKFLGDGKIWAQLGRKIPLFCAQIRSSRSVRPTDSTGLSRLAIGSIPIARSRINFARSSSPSDTLRRHDSAHNFFLNCLTSQVADATPLLRVFAVGRSGDAQEHQDGTIQPDHILVSEASHTRADLRFWNSRDFVHHQSADDAQAVSGAWLDA